MLFPSSLRSSVKEQQFSVPITDSQEHTEGGCRGSIKPHTSFTYGILHLPSALSCPPWGVPQNCQRSWKKEEHQVQLPLTPILLENFLDAIISFSKHISA